MKSPAPDPGKNEPANRPTRRSPAEKKIRIKVIGVGGAGVNAIDQLMLDGFESVSLLSVNTDAQALASSVVTEKLQIGENLTHGLGAGGDPQVGRYAALEDIELLRDLVEGYDLIFIAAGMGGGTGTGAAPVIANVAREEGALVLAFTTMPFTHEGRQRMEIARDGLAAMQGAADAVICVPNDKLLALSGEDTSVLDAFRPTDDFLSNGVRRIWQMLARTGHINIDFADLRSVLQRQNGETLFGFGEGSGEDKLRQAITGALGSPLLQDNEMLARAGSVIVGVTHGPDFTMAQLRKLMEEVHGKLGAGAACKQGIVVDENHADRLSLVIIASTGEPIRAAVKPPAMVAREPRRPATEMGAAFKGMLSDETVRKPAAARKKEKPQMELAGILPKQETLKLDESTRGLFERVERTVLDGEDLDRPTFIRRGVALRGA